MKTIPLITCSFALSFTIAISGVAFVEWRRIDQEPRFVKNPERYYGLYTPYDAYLTVLSVDQAEGSALVNLRSNTVNQDIPTKVFFDKDMVVDRRTPLFEGDVIIGSTPSVKAARSDIQPGVRGIGRLVEDAGKYILYYVLIGDPFPRP